MHESLGFAHFLAGADGVAKFILAVMLFMSVGTWYLIVTKAIQNAIMRGRSRRFLQRFWDAHGLAAVGEDLAQRGAADPFSRLVRRGLAACEQHRRSGAHRLIEAGSADEFLTRALRRSMEQDTAQLEQGLTFLASVGSSAPFIGLFGTVWGIYHALLAIGLSGQGTLDKVAGPVGEALLMTALGLAVAIPAVLAYNTFTRANRVLLSDLDGFAHDVFAFIVTGVRGGEPARAGRPEPQPVRSVAASAGGG